MEINGIKFFGRNNISENNTAGQNGKEVTEKQKGSSLISNPLTEILGRSLVNFRGQPADKVLTPEDKGMIDLIGKIYKPDPEAIDFIQKYTSDFLKEKGVKSLHKLYREDPVEYANETAGYIETISDKLGLNDYEAMDLEFLIVSHICSGDISSEPDVYKNYRYTRDKAPYTEAMKSLGVDDMGINLIFANLNDLAEKYNYDSIFDIFSKDNMDDRKDEVQEILGRYFKKEPYEVQENSDKSSDAETSEATNTIMFELYNLAKKTHEQRMENINPNIMSETVKDGLNTLVIVNALSEKFGIPVTEELLDIVNSRKTYTKLHENGDSLEKIAFTIADKYDLPQGAEKVIIAIIEKYNNDNFDEEKMYELVNVLIADL